MRNMRNLSILPMMVLAWALLLPGIAGALRIGVVDVAKVSEGSQFFKSQLAELEKFRQEKEGALLQQRDLALFSALFTPDELTAYRELLSKPQPTPEDQTKMEDLENLSNTRAQELMRLRPIPSDQRTLEQQARLSELNALYQAAIQRQMQLQELETNTGKEIDAREAEVTGKLWEEFVNTVQSVAKEKKLDLVLQESVLLRLGQASQEVLLCLYVDPNSDVTDAVIAAIELAHPTQEEAPKSP